MFTPVNLFKNNPDDKTQQRPIEAVKHTITANGSLIKTLSTVSTWPEHRKGDCSFGRQGDTQRGDTKLYDRRLGPLQRWFSTAVGENPRFPKQTTQIPEASGNRCEVLSYLFRKKSMNLKLISGEFHKMQCFKIKKGRRKFKK